MKLVWSSGGNGASICIFISLTLPSIYSSCPHQLTWGALLAVEWNCPQRFVSFVQLYPTTVPGTE